MVIGRVSSDRAVLVPGTDQATVVLHRPGTALLSQPAVSAMARVARKPVTRGGSSGKENETPVPGVEDADGQAWCLERLDDGEGGTGGGQSGVVDEEGPRTPRPPSHTSVSSIGSSSVASRNGSQSSWPTTSGTRSVSHTPFSSISTSVYSSASTSFDSSTDTDTDTDNSALDDADVNVRDALMDLVNSPLLPKDTGIAFSVMANMLYGVAILLYRCHGAATPNPGAVDRIKVIAREIVLLYDGLKAQLAERLRALAEVKLCLPSLRRLRTSGELETACRIWRERLGWVLRFSPHLARSRTASKD